MIEVFLAKQKDKVRLIDALKSMDLPYKVKITQGGKRSLEQNAYLWGVCYPTILERGGEALGGWTSNDLHEYFLGEHFGWQTIKGFGKTRMKPLDRSSNKVKMEFVDFVASIQIKAAEMGIVIPDPE